MKGEDFVNKVLIPYMEWKITEKEIKEEIDMYTLMNLEA